MKTKLLFLSALLAVAACKTDKKETKVVLMPSDQEQIELAATITEEELKEHLYTYASDDFEGRETGTAGQKKAVEYLVSQYSSLGIPMASGTANYLQKVPVTYTTAPSGSLSINDRSYTIGTDFVSFSAATGSYEAVFVGYGIDTPEYSNYGDIEVEGKLVIAMAGEPQNEDGTYTLTNTTTYSKWSNVSEALPKRIEVAKSKGASGLIFVDQANFERYERYFNYMKRNNSGQMRLAEEQPLFSAIFNPEKAQEWLANLDQSLTQPLEQTVSIAIEGGSELVDTENVVAVIEGIEKPEEYVIVSSHLDHIGIDSEGNINNGADDDGSGTVAMLEIAEALAEAKAQGKGPKRSVVFLHVTGEEKGLLGSEYYTDVAPLYPLENTVTNLNIDMIGRIDPERDGDRNYIYLIGSDKLSTELHQLSEEMNSKFTQLELDYTYNDENDPNRFYYRSDHYNFAKNNIPIIFYFNGTHEDYHAHTDTPDKINYDLLTNRTRLVFHTLLEVANREERPRVDQQPE